MEPRSLEFIVRACAGKLISGAAETLISGVSTDSRRIREGEVFFALAGERFDGHDFLPEMVKKAAAVVVLPGRMPPDAGKCAVVTAGNPRQALGRLAGEYRKDFHVP